MALHFAKSLQIGSASVELRDLRDSASKILFGAPLAGSVNCCEDDMILSPKTGQPIANDVELESFMMKREPDE